jgi:hypothetical protein
MSGMVPLWSENENIDYELIEIRLLAASGLTPQRFRDLYECRPAPPTFEEQVWHKLRARPAKFSWGDPIPGLWDVPGYPELTTAQLEQVMRERGYW